MRDLLTGTARVRSIVARARRRPSSIMWRGVVVLLLGSLLLTACGGGGAAVGGGPGGPLDERMENYEESLREELNWLWETMALLNTYQRPIPEICEDKTFEHNPVTITDEEREADETGGKLVDHLDYAGTLIAQAHEQWSRFCSLDAAANDTYALMNSRLLAANDSLNLVRDTIRQRKEPVQ